MPYANNLLIDPGINNPVKDSLYYYGPNEGKNAPGESSFLITEAGNFLITEIGNELITEG